MKKTKFSIYEKPIGTIFDKSEFSSLEKLLKSKKSLTRGEDIFKFEDNFSKYLECKHAFAVSSCSAALEISSKVLSLKKGDEVLVQSNSFWTAINHLLKIGVKIKCLDIDSRNLNVSFEDIKKKISSRTKAIYVMHHGGVPIDIKKLKSKLRYNIPIVEDCAHALGSSIAQQKVGTNSDIACFSFSSLKNISTGEGGMIVTNSKDYAKKIELLRDGKAISKYIKIKSRIKNNLLSSNRYLMPIGDNLEKKINYLENIGSTFRMSSLQACVGISQLKKIDILNKKRNNIAKIYERKLNKFKSVRLIKISQKDYSCYHLFNFLIVSNIKDLRNKIDELLIKEFNIFNKIRFSPISWYPEMEYLNKCKPFGCKNCKKLSNINNSWLFQQMSLPINPDMKNKEVNYIINSTLKILNKLNIG